MANEDKRKMKPQVKPAAKGYKAEAKSILPFTKKNYLWFAVGLAMIVLGYITLGYGSITLAPILLVLGYCVIIPVAIIINGRKEKPKEPARKEAEMPSSELRSGS
jgi:ABC-type bacteriocin/lantibiotic exporter with double-glycine peptidase domain